MLHAEHHSQTSLAALSLAHSLCAIAPPASHCRTPSSVVFESFAPETAGGGLLATHTYGGSVGGTASNNFAPGAERFHFNYWVRRFACGCVALHCFASLWFVSVAA